MNHCRKALFLLTRPLRDVTIWWTHRNQTNRISTHTPLTGRDNILGQCRTHMNISTHTPLTGRDGLLWLPLSSAAISTHTPLTGRDLLFLLYRLLQQPFLLTRPLRDVTGYPGLWLIFPSFLLTRPLRDVTALLAAGVTASVNFYSHAPYGT